MKTTRQTIVFALFCLAAGFGLGSIVREPQALATQAIDAAPGGYALSAFGSGPDHYGCYIVDTQSGNLWLQRSSGDAKRIGTLK